MRATIYNTICVFALLLHATLIFSQTGITDSLQHGLQEATTDSARVRLLNDLCWEFAIDDPYKSITYGTTAEDLSERTHNQEGLFLAKRYMARTYHMLLEYEKAMDLLYSAVAIGSGSTISDRDMALAYNDIGTIMEEQNDFPNALKTYEQAIDFAEKDENDYLASIIRINICYTLHDIQDFEKILTIANEALAVFAEVGDHYNIALVYNMIGDAHAGLGHYDKAQQWQEKSLEIFQEYGAYERISEVYNSMGSLYLLQDKWDLSLKYYNLSLAIDDSLQNYANIAISYSNIAGVYYDLGQPDTALVLLQKSIELATEYGQLKNLMASYLYTSEAFATVEDYESAFKYREIYENIKDSIYSIEKRKEIIRIQEEYETEKHKEQIILLEAENANVIANARLNYTLLFGGLIILLFLIVLVLLYLKNVRAKAERSQAELEKSLLSLKSTALMAQLNPHLVFNILNSIQGLVANGQIEMANSYISKFSKFMRKTLQLSQASHIPIDQELIATEQYFELEQLRFGDRLKLVINNDLKSDKLEVPPLIIQPLIENAIKHGIVPTDQSGLITLSLTEDEQAYNIELSDNGKGFPKNPTFHDGLRISQERLKTLNPNNTLSITSYTNPTSLRITILK